MSQFPIVNFIFYIILHNPMISPESRIAVSLSLIIAIYFLILFLFWRGGEVCLACFFGNFLRGRVYNMNPLWSYCMGWKSPEREKRFGVWDQNVKERLRNFPAKTCMCCCVCRNLKLLESSWAPGFILTLFPFNAS